MQLKGAPRINDWTAPKPAKQTPLRAAFRRDRDVETYVKTRDGTLARVGDQALRGRFTFGWDGLDYDTALRILYEVRSGEVELTPRTDIGGSGTIDIDGDGIPDLVLEEVRLPCRVIEDIPTSTPIGRRARQAEIAGLELTFETLQTYSQIPGFTTPAQVQMVTSGTGSDWTVEFGFGISEALLVDWYSDGTVTSLGESNPSHTYLATEGPELITIVLPRTIDTLQNVGSGEPIDGAETLLNFTSPLIGDGQTDFSDLTVQNQFKPSGQAKPEGQLPGSKMPKSIGSWQSVKMPASFNIEDVPVLTDGKIFVSGGSVTGNLQNLQTQNVRILQVIFTFSVVVNLAPGGPIGPSTEVVELQRNAGSPTIDCRQGAGYGVNWGNIGSDGGASSMLDFRMRGVEGIGGGAGQLLRGMRDAERFRGPRVDDMRDDPSGTPCIPPSMENLRLRFKNFSGNVRYAPDSFDWLEGCTLRYGFTESGDYFEDSDGNPLQASFVTNLRSWIASNNVTQIPGGVWSDRAVNDSPKIVICTHSQDDFSWMFGLDEYHPIDGTSNEVPLTEIVDAVVFTPVRSEDEWKRNASGNVEITIRGIFDGNDKFEYEINSGGLSANRVIVTAGIGESSAGTQDALTKRNLFKAGDTMRLSGEYVSGGSFDKQIQIASATVIGEDLVASEPTRDRYDVTVEIVPESSPSAGYYTTTVPDVDTSMSRNAFVAPYFQTTGVIDKT